MNSVSMGNKTLDTQSFFQNTQLKFKVVGITQLLAKAYLLLCLIIMGGIMFKYAAG